MKILLYGGTFDPPHYGHIHNLRAAAARVLPDLVIVMPAGVPPHKAASHTDADLRLEMTRAAFLPLKGEPGIPEITVSDWEIQRAREGIANYTSSTLEMLAETHPGAQLYFTVGSDMLLTFRKWHEWQHILQLAVLVAVSRETDDDAALRASAAETDPSGTRILFAPAAALPMSSSGIRARYAAGERCEDALPAGVRAVIEREKLYGFVPQEGAAE